MRRHALFIVAQLLFFWLFNVYGLIFLPFVIYHVYKKEDNGRPGIVGYRAARGRNRRVAIRIKKFYR